MPCRGRKTSDVSNHSPTNTDYHVVASDAHLGELLTQVLNRLQRLRSFSLRDGDNF